MDIRKILTYTDNCRCLLQQTLDAHPEALAQPLETTSQFRSIHALVAHCIGAEQRWIEQRLCGQEAAARYETQAAETREGLFRDWDHVRAKTRGFIDSLGSPDNPRHLHQEIAYTLPHQGISDVLTVEEILFHAFNHQIYHLAQISMALQQQGIDPPNFDYCLLHDVDALTPAASDAADA